MNTPLFEKFGYYTNLQDKEVYLTAPHCTIEVTMKLRDAAYSIFNSNHGKQLLIEFLTEHLEARQEYEAANHLRAMFKPQ